MFHVSKVVTFTFTYQVFLPVSIKILSPTPKIAVAVLWLMKAWAIC